MIRIRKPARAETATGSGAASEEGLFDATPALRDTNYALVAKPCT